MTFTPKVWTAGRTAALSAALILAAGAANAQSSNGPAGGQPPVTSGRAGTVIAPTPPPPIKPPVQPPGPDGSTCNQSSAALLKSAASAPQGTLLLGGGILPSDAATDFTYIQPTGQAVQRLELRVFLGTESLSVLSVSHPSVSATVKAVVDNQNTYGVRAQIADKSGFSSYEDETLTVVACDSQSGVVVGTAAAAVRTSNRTFALVAAVAIMVAAYALAGWIRWMATCSTKDVNQTLASRLAVAGRPRARLSHERPPLSLLNCFNPVVISADVFYRASLSQLQVLFFLMLTGFGVCFSLLRTGTLSDLSASIVYLLGIPALGALGSQTVSASRDRFSVDNWTWLVDHRVLAIDDPGTKKPQWRDLLLTGATVDLYKLQALVFSVIVGVAMIMSIFSGVNTLETFRVPDTLLQILGLSQAVFVGGHFTAPTTMGDADGLITELRSRACNLQVAAASGVDINCTGQPLRVVDPSAQAAATNKVTSIAQAYTIVPIAAAHYEEIANEVEIILKGLTYRDVVTDRLKDPFKWYDPPAAPPKNGPPGPPPTAPPVMPAPAIGQ